MDDATLAELDVQTVFGRRVRKEWSINLVDSVGRVGHAKSASLAEAQRLAVEALRLARKGDIS